MTRFFFSEEEMAELRSRPAPATGLIFLFGAGHVGRNLAERFHHAGIVVAGFLYNNPTLQGKTVAGLPVFPPAETMKAYPEAAVVVTSAYHVDAILSECRQQGARDVMDLVECVRRFRLLAEHERIEADPDARAAMELWEDDASRGIYRRLVRYRATGDSADLPAPAPNQYFHKDVMKPKWLRSFVDCGAYNGDTYTGLIQASQNDFAAYYGFEPDPRLFPALAKATAEDARVRLFNKAVSDRAGRLQFGGIGPGSSGLVAGGSVEVEVDSLDNVLAATDVTCIKMDVEGNELLALAGAEKLIRRQRPLLAICNYHETDHLWRVPLWIAGLNLGYRFRQLHHSELFIESVCYALPE